MLKFKQKSFILVSIIAVSLLFSNFLITTSVPNQPPPGPSCDLLVINNEVRLDFPLTDVFGVYNATEFEWDQDWRAQPNAQNYYTATSSYSNVTTGGSVITGILLANETRVVAVVMDDKSPINMAIDSVCPSGPCGFSPFVVSGGNLWVPHLLQGDSLEAIFLKNVFDWNAFDLDPAGFLLNPGITNYLTASVTINGQDISNLDPVLEGQHVVVVIKNIDGFIYAHDQFDDCQNGPCTNFVDFIVINGFIDIPQIGSPDGPQPSQLDLLGIFLMSEFDWPMFSQNPDQYLIDHNAINHVAGATVQMGGIQVADTSLEGFHVVIVFIDRSLPVTEQHTEANDGFCNDYMGGMDHFPFDTLNFGVVVGNILEYRVSISGMGGGQSVPLFDLMNDDGTEFTVSHLDNITIEVLKLPTLADLMNKGDPNNPPPQKLTQNNQPPADNQDGLGIRLKFTSGTNHISDSQAFGFVFPLEFIQLALTDPDNFTKFLQPEPDPNNPNPGNPQDNFNPFSNILSFTTTTITFGNTSMSSTDGLKSFKVTMDITKGVATRFEMEGNSPDNTGGTGALTLELTSDLSNLLTAGQTDLPTNSTDNNQTSTSSANGEDFQSSASGFELISIVFLLLIAPVIYRKRRSQ